MDEQEARLQNEQEKKRKKKMNCDFFFLKKCPNIRFVHKSRNQLTVNIAHVSCVILKKNLWSQECLLRKKSVEIYVS